MFGPQCFSLNLNPRYELCVCVCLHVSQGSRGHFPGRECFEESSDRSVKSCQGLSVCLIQRRDLGPTTAVQKLENQQINYDV